MLSGVTFDTFGYTLFRYIGIQLGQSSGAAAAVDDEYTLFFKICHRM